MNLRLGLLLIILALFGGYSTWLLMDVGYFAIWAAGFINPSTFQILLDLSIACAIILSWMIGDARARGVTIWPWFIAVLTTGTLAILVYLVLRERAKIASLESSHS